MVDISQAQLQDPDRRINAIERAPVNTTGASIAKAAEAGVGVVKEVVDRNRAVDFTDTLTDISDQSNRFNAETSNIFNELSTADSAKVSSLQNRLSKLNRGEVQGVLTPASAKAKADAAYRSAIAAHPGLASEFSRIRSATTFGMGGASGASGMSPQQKAWNDYEERVLNGMFTTKRSREEVEGSIRMSALNAEQVDQNNARKSQGAPSFPDELAPVDAASNNAYIGSWRMA